MFSFHFYQIEFPRIIHFSHFTHIKVFFRFDALLEGPDV